MRRERIVEEIMCWSATIAMFFVPRHLPLPGLIIYCAAWIALMILNTRMAIRAWKEAKTLPKRKAKVIRLHITWPMAVVFFASVFAFVALLWYALARI